jgi:Zn-finger nucleic acid-binding protein
MIVLELDQIEVDYCSSCSGIWLDAGELELLLEGSDRTDAFLRSFQAGRCSGEKPRKCPICSRRMEKVAVGKENRVCIDRCRRGDGIWLDGGELEEVLRMNSLGEDRRVVHLLVEMFAKDK